MTDLPTSPHDYSNDELTIEQAQHLYKKYGDGAVNSNYKGLIDDLIDNDVELSFSNDSYLDALFLSQKMLDRTRHNFDLVCGVSTGKFFEILREHVFNCLENLKTNKGLLRVIALGEEAPHIFEEIGEKYPDQFSFRLAAPNDKVLHFMTADDRMVRIEEAHPPLESGMLASKIKAKVTFDDPSLARLYRNIFEKGWERL